MRAPFPPPPAARRSFIATLLGAWVAKAQAPATSAPSSSAPSSSATSSSATSSSRNFPPAAVRYSDPATEFTVLRLTDSQYSSHLGVGNRNISGRGMLYACDITGLWQAYWMDLKKRGFRQLTEAVALDIDSLSLLPSERGFYYFDETGLHEADLAGVKRNREIYRVPGGFTKTQGVSFNDSSVYASFVERGQGVFRLRLLDLPRGSAVTLLESPEPIDNLLFRPRHNALLYRHSGGVVMANLDGSQRSSVPLRADETLQFQWTADGASLWYLNRPPDASKLTGLREWTPETGADTWIGNTSQFVRFHTNANASVIIGASGSKASPYILLLIRAGKRELTLAEHRASDARITAPQFSPNSQAIFFTSDRHGKPAIYWMPVDKLVSETDGS